MRTGVRQRDCGAADELLGACTRNFASCIVSEQAAEAVTIAGPIQEVLHVVELLWRLDHTDAHGVK